MSVFVETDRLVLRPFTVDGADLLIELDSDPEVMRHLTGGEPTLPPAVVREQVIPNVLATYERWHGRFGLFAGYEKAGGDFIGWFQLRPEREGPLDEVELGLRLVWGETMAVNLASQKVMEKVGMSVVAQIPTPESMQGVEGAERGGLRYQITKEQWDRR